MGRIIVIGSSNTDMVVKSLHIPAAGETVIGDNFMVASGGKGANQAVAAKRLGGDVVFVTKLGRDFFGDNTFDSLVGEGFDPDYILRDDASASGVALINVDSKGENSIVVAPGANYSFTEQDVDSLRGLLETADYVLLQLEIPMDIVRRIVDMAYLCGVKVILNPAPAAHLDDELLSKLYMITPNETECMFLCGCAEKDICACAGKLLDKGVKNVIVTLGGKGSLLLNEEGAVTVPACKVKAVDTTAAGDTYNGALCVALARGMSIVDAIGFATKAAAISVTRPGAQPSVPTLDEVESFKF